MYVIFVTLFNVFDKHKEKYAKLDFKFISLEINYFVETGYFLFLRNIDTFLFQVQTYLSHSPFFLLYFLFISLLLHLAWQLLLDF